MNRTHVSRLTAANSERVLLALTHQQHLHPARTVADTVRRVCQGQGFPDGVGQQALDGLAISGSTSTGRLLREQVRELAQHMELAWQAELQERTCFGILH